MEGADEFSEGHQFPTLDVKEVPVSSFSASVPISSFSASVPASSFNASIPASSFNASIPTSSFNASIPTSSFNASVSASSSSASVPISLPGFQPSLGLKLGSEMDTSSDHCTMVQQEKIKNVSLVLLKGLKTTDDMMKKHVERCRITGGPVKAGMRDQQYMAQLPNRNSLVVARENLAKAMSLLSNIAFAGAKPIPSNIVSVASDGSIRQCTCSSSHNHEALLSETRRVFKFFDDEKDLRRALYLHRLQPEATSFAEDEAESESSSRKNLLKGLLKKAVARFKCIDRNNYRSLVENQQAVNKLKEHGFTKEYNIFQRLHNAKVNSESEACTSEITKLFAKCHL